MRLGWMLSGLLAACASQRPAEPAPQPQAAQVQPDPVAPAPTQSSKVHPPQAPPKTKPLAPRFGRRDVLAVKGCRVLLPGQIQFEVDRARLHELSEPVLAALLETVKAYPDERFRIEGHVAKLSSYGLKPSERRAKAVVRYLGERGIERDRLRAIGYGMDRPLAPNDTAERRAMNRRIEVVVEDCEP